MMLPCMLQRTLDAGDQPAAGNTTIHHDSGAVNAIAAALQVTPVCAGSRHIRAAKPGICYKPFICHRTCVAGMGWPSHGRW